MVQSTDSTQVMPLSEAPQAQFDPDATHEMPIVPPTTAPAVAVVPQPPYDPARQYAIHTHTVLGRILRTAGVPMPMSYETHLWVGRQTIEFLLDPLTVNPMDAYRRVFGGEFTSEDRPPRGLLGAMRYDRLWTVVDGVEFVVKQFVEVPAAEQPVEEPCTHEVSNMRTCVGCGESLEPTEAEAAAFDAEPEPAHDPAPETPAETPAEHPEAA